ncbi:MAG: DUF3095 family protein [Rhodothermales bacterium]
MPAVSDASFFADLPVHSIALSDLLGHEALFMEIPAGWHVVVTDIKNSTRAHRAGRHEEINLIAAGSIIATLNLARRERLAIPFFFGGDGASMIVPEGLLAPVLGALSTHRTQTMESFGLDLRVGSSSVASLYEAGHPLRIARLALTGRYAIPILLGTGLSEAERRVKQADEGLAASNFDDALDLSGMECRWDRIEPAHAAHEIVCLLVNAGAGRSQAAAFRAVVELIDRVYGSPEARNPVSTSRLRLDPGFQKIALETRVRLGRLSLSHLVSNWALTQGSRIGYFAREAGRSYKQALVEQTDTLVIDGRINTVIAGTAAQRAALDAGLADMEAAGEIAYGLFVCRESIMSCYITDRSDRHIHFVDGSDGGYTMAATLLKGKRR